MDLKAWEALDSDTQGLIDDLAKSFNMTVFSRFQAINGPALQQLVNEHNVEIKTFPGKF